MDAEQLLHDLELANENLELSDNQLETLRAENEALKVDNENTNALWSEALELLGGKVQEVEAKDAQIRGLVEALDKAGNFIEDEYLNTNCQTSLKTEKQLEEIDKALATIPAEALELAKLEREVVKGGMVLHKTGNPEPFEYAIRKYEAHKEGRG